MFKFVNLDALDAEISAKSNVRFIKVKTLSERHFLKRLCQKVFKLSP